MSYALKFEFSVHYNIQRPVSASDVIDSLNGLSKLLPGVLPVLREYDHRHGPRGVVCNVKSIEEGSLRDWLSLNFIFKNEAAALKWIRSVRDRTGISNLDHRFPGLATITNALVLFSGASSLNRAASSDTIVSPDDAATLKESAVDFTQTGSGVLGIPAERLHDLLEQEGQKPAIGKAACTFVKPAKVGGSAASITLADNSETSDVGSTLSSEMVSAMPNSAEHQPLETYTQELDRTELRIRSCDIDYPNKGWNAIVPAVSDKRLPISIEQGIDRECIGLGTYQARVVLEYTVDDEGNRKYKRATLKFIYAD